MTTVLKHEAVLKQLQNLADHIPNGKAESTKNHQTAFTQSEINLLYSSFTFCQFYYSALHKTKKLSVSAIVSTKSK